MQLTVQDLIKQSNQQLQGRVDDPHTDTQALLCHCLDVNRAWLITHADDVQNKSATDKIHTAIQRRANGEPVAYITGTKEFWSHRFKVTPDVLIPRPETEHLIEQALALDLPDENINVLDFGTGSGVVAITLAKERPGWQVTAMDISDKALSIAVENARGCEAENIRFTQGSRLNDTGKQGYTLIVSNPPYIETSDPHLQQGDVRFEPGVALVSGEDGLDCIRMLIKESPACLTDGGHLILEHGFEHGAKVRKLLQDNNYSNIHTVHDLSGNERITMATWDRYE